ncbi:efflux RND transporter permease subunit [Permianibacter sp. IMCC34836]|uniref:efflux RND transporter permease subunit n=1 Tax=Permianibacter fluminis TaxID=2738515 RepID=UPI0015547063|nr:efflux RND transporter permease subunit [Permianibacter fluminis]NQD36332.1 efflux RND transporter permease subunit [Permianibacter fluminis]
MSHSPSPDENSAALGFAGRIAARFQDNALTPLLALIAALLGLFAVLVTPREEEPQIDVTMATVLVPFPGASAKDVEQMIAVPAEQVLGQLAGLEHIYSVSQPGAALITVQFQVGVKRETALTRLYDAVHSNADWLPAKLGALPPLVRAKGIDDVPVLALTLASQRRDNSAYDLERVAHNLENELKRVPGTREIKTLGGPGRVIEVRLDATRLAAANLTIADLRYALSSANQGLAAGDLVQDNHSIRVDVGPFLDSADAVANLVVGVRRNVSDHSSVPVYLHQVAEVVEGPASPNHYVWHWQRTTIGADANTDRNTNADVATNALLTGEQPAVTLQITKKPGSNAVTVTRAVLAQVEQLKGVLIPDEINVHVSRNYGETANAKATQLIQKLIFATLSVVALVLFALGKREAAIVGIAVLLTLTATLFASWAYGFTLNRVSLFALIFSIGILVDDAIVVVENIHRHQQLHPGLSLSAIIPRAVDEVGGPTILATFTVIAALLPMAFVSGLMGPYMAPIPINASMGMLISLAIAFVLTPWLARRWLAHAGSAHTGSSHANSTNNELANRQDSRSLRLFQRIFTPLLAEQTGSRARRKLLALIGGLIALSLALPVLQAVVMKMLPFDNKSEFQLMVDLPEGAPVEQTATVLHALADYLQTVPEVTDYQAYAGLSAPITFNGLVRQYDWRQSPELGDLQVNLLPKSERHEKSHAIAQHLLPALQQIADQYGADLKLVEVPPGPPVLAPIVAEVYGPDDAGRLQVAKQVRAAFAGHADIVGIDDSSVAPTTRLQLQVDRNRAALLGVSQAEIASTLRTALSGEDVTYLHDGLAKYPAPVRLTLPRANQSQLDDVLKLTVTSSTGKQVPLSELLRVGHQPREQVLYHKNGLPVIYVVGDKSGQHDHNDSPLYGMFGIRSELDKINIPGQGRLSEYFIKQPPQAWTGYAIKWDGEWQITYETFRDMGAAYAVGLLLIYLLVVAEFRSYITPLIIMAPIPLTIIGVMPGHALLGAQFTATSMIGMIALAGIIVRNSILLVDFIELQIKQGLPFKDAIVQSAATRAQPIILTGLAAMLGAFFILDDPIFNGLAISLIFGVMVSTVLTLVVIPLLYFIVFRRRHLQAGVAS